MIEKNASTGKGKCKLIKDDDFPRHIRQIIRSKINPSTGLPTTTKEVAEDLGISESSLNMQLANNPTTNMLRSIAVFLGCDMADFFKSESSTKAPKKTLTAMVEYQGIFYKACTLAELKDVIKKIETSNCNDTE